MDIVDCRNRFKLIFFYAIQVSKTSPNPNMHNREVKATLLNP